MATLEKIYSSFVAMLSLIREVLQKGEALENLVSISYGNIKMGKIPSVSLAPVLSCPWARCKNTCGQKCYAIKLCRIRKNVLDSYTKNTAIMKLSPKAFFKAVDNVMKTNRFFRFHVSGDIPNRPYFRNVVKCAKNNPHCEVLIFTKQYEIVNEWIDQNGKLPKNLHVLFSEWVGLKAINPHNLPTTNVYEKKEDIRSGWKLCGGNCLDCACRGSHCWKAKNGETIAFKIH